MTILTLFNLSCCPFSCLEEAWLELRKLAGLGGNRLETIVSSNAFQEPETGAV